MRKAASLSFLLAMSCGGGTCGGCIDADYRFPQDDPERPDAVVQEDVVRLRITQDFLDFIRPQLPDLIVAQAGALGGGVTLDRVNRRLRIPVPDTTLFNIGVAEALVREAEAFIYLDDLEQRLSLDLTEPSGAELVIDRIRVGLSLKLKEDFLGSTSSCPVVGDLTNSEPRHAAEATVRATIDPGVGPRPDYTLDVNVQVGTIEINDFAVGLLGRNTYCQEPECRDCTVVVFGTCLDPGGRCVECDIFCGAITNGIASLISALSDLLRPTLNDIIAPIVQDLVRDAVASIDGTSAKIETPLDLVALTGLDILRRSEVLGVLGAPRPGRLAVNDRGSGLGMELTFDSGLEAPAADCVGPLAPFTPERGPTPTLSGLDRMGRPYHFGVTLAASYLNQALYTAHRAGTLCLKLSSDDIRQLSGGAFSLNASLLSLVASDLNKLAEPAAPVIVELKPRNPATVELGTGERTGVDDMGNDLFDWLLKVRMVDVGVAFHVLIQDRYVRIFEVTSDAFVGLNVAVQPDNTLQVTLGELRIDDFQEEFNELLPNADFAEVVPTLLDVALGALLNQALIFDLDLTGAVSDALGGAPVFLRVNDIFRDGVQQDYLTMSVTFSSTTAQPFFLPVQTLAYVHPSEPGVLVRPPDDGGQARTTGAVRLVVGEGLPAPTRATLEYQVRVDGGLWSIWRPARPDGTLLAPDARLKMPGWHQVEVRARSVDDYRSADPTPEQLRVLVDPLGPTMRATHGETGIEVLIRDLESQDGAALTLAMRTSPAAPWVPVPLDARPDHAATAVIGYERLAGAERLYLRARDGSGNRSRTLAVSLTTPAPQAPASEAATEDEVAGCRCHRRAGPIAPWLAVALFGALWLRRRR